jgi:hypothetical protein
MQYHNFFDSINIFNKQNGYMSDYHLIKNFLIQTDSQRGGIGPENEQEIPVNQITQDIQITDIKPSGN